MENSANEALYTGVYIFVFIIALTSTIYLFMSVDNLANLSFEYGKEVIDKSLLVDVPVSRYKIISPEEVISYYYNYVQRDLYGSSLDESDKNNGIVYNVTILDVNNRPIEKDSSKFGNYNNLIKKIKFDEKYILIYNKYNSGGNEATVTIRIATDEEVKQQV